MMKGRALLFGLNYEKTDCELRGCINDVINMGAYINKNLKFPTKVCIDPESTKGIAMVQSLYELAIQSHTESLECVFIHYSGHGSYTIDQSRDEADGRDECLVPSDYMTAGLIPDDLLEKLFRYFNPKTRVIFICDACHSGTICDLKWSWAMTQAVKLPTSKPQALNLMIPTVENVNCMITAKVITISGCMDDQTSADAFNVLGDGKFSGALTSCLLKVLADPAAAFAARSNVFVLIAYLTASLTSNGFPQRPKLCSTYDLSHDRKFV